TGGTWMNTETAITASELACRLADFPSVNLVDVRRAEAFARDRNVIPGARKHAPEAVAEWASTLDSWRPVVVYCVHGLEVGRGADTNALSLAPQAPGLLAASQGLSMLFADDHAMLDAGMMVYDALYLWCRSHAAA